MSEDTEVHEQQARKCSTHMMINSVRNSSGNNLKHIATVSIASRIYQRIASLFCLLLFWEYGIKVQGLPQQYLLCLVENLLFLSFIVVFLQRTLF